jgi:hypothetical protein
MNSANTCSVVTGVLCYLLRRSGQHKEICLAEKAVTPKSQERGIAGKRIGYGGDRAGDWESYEDAAIRKVLEESGVAANRIHLKKFAIIDFDRPEFTYRCHHFFIEGFSDDPRPSEEMLDPRWYPIRQIPYHLMDPSSLRILPFAISGRLVQGRVRYDMLGNAICSDVGFVSTI